MRELGSPGPRTGRRAFPLLLALWALLAPASRGQLVVEKVATGRAAEAAGLQAGDLLLEWSRSVGSTGEAPGGLLVSPFEPLLLQIEQGSRGPVALVGHRGAEKIEVILGSGSWGLDTRPALEPELASAYAALAEDREDGSPATSQGLTTLAEEAPDPMRRSWLLFRAGENDLAGGRIGDADRRFSASLAAAAAHGDARFEMGLRARIGNALRRSGALASAEPVFDGALALVEPGSLLAAGILSDLAIVQASLGRLDEAEATWTTTLGIYRDLLPGGTDEGDTLNNLGVVAFYRGDLARAEELYRQSLAISEQHATDDLDLAASYHNLATIARERGDLARAEELGRRALELRQRVEPDSVEVAQTLNNLGVIARDRWDLATAERLYRESLEIRREKAPGSLEVAEALGNLGGVLFRRRELAEAEATLRQALEIKEAIAPGSRDVTSALETLAAVVADTGDTDAARDLLLRSLEIHRTIGEGSLGEALDLVGLGDLALGRDDPDGAESRYLAALAIRRRLAPASAALAESLHSLGHLRRVQGRRGEAIELLREAVDTLESQQERLGGDDRVRGAFRGRYQDLYEELLDLLLDAGLDGEAFALLERSRARSFLHMLAERDLIFSDLPAEVETRRRLLLVDRARVRTRLAGLSPRAEPEAVQAALEELEELREAQARLEQEIRRDAPRLAELQYPEPLTAIEAAATLEEGTVALAYAVGAETSALFVLDPAGLRRVVRASWGREELGAEVASLRRAMESGEVGAEPGAWRDTARSLYDRLVAPVAAEVEGARRLLVLPDGPLHLLPFGALLPSGPSPRPLGAVKPLRFAVSMTVYRELAARRPTTPARPLVAFADPQVSGETGVSRPRWVGLGSLAALPGTRREATAVAEIYGEAAQARMGAEATEASVRSEAPHAARLHFATHGLVDERRPLESGLVLSASGEDDGFLQTWEVLEALRLDADLVVLSACQTGLGAEVAGEGLVGLTRAFHFAGATSVVASLWSVDDESTATLMTAFHRELAAGRAADEALRTAQATVRGTTEPDLSHPFYWAGFQLYGPVRSGSV